MSSTTVGVVCRQLGCADSGTLKPTSADKTPSRLMWIDNVQCPKGVDTLWQCPSSPWKQRQASPSEESWIVCDSHSVLVALLICGAILLVLVIAFLLWTLKRRQIQRLTGLSKLMISLT
ncbi:Scavenger receptor cysteine-rich type 1 protein M130 [Cricetulus griseus]|uniref:Scavenger receptor cysteine-rich type 1 protein M130 n=1 Tax=Cricetulus griseus TaxID=10029 RepID=G3GUR6_CRIGR|nr:Scavenger receptor cysteine-rich type 1 protein M130 [Cricetulus griseus]